VGAAHDAIRGVEGAYDRAVETYRRVQSLKGRYSNFRLGVTAVLSSFNLDEIFPLLEKLEKDFVLDRREVMLARGQTREPSAKDVPLERFEKVHEWLNEHNRGLDSSFTGRFLYQLSRRKREIEVRTAREDRLILPCVAGRKMAVLDADGTVRPCEILHTLYPDRDLTLGALRSADYDLPGILNTDKARNVVEFIRRTRCYCTFECAILAGLVFQPRQWLRLGLRTIFD
jgi:MoaA/NifB/PqqE/SkfB family radical SAM enzyme